jgi:hypothetical protein
MKSTKIAAVAILLWVITIAVVAWFFVRGNTAAGTDGRTAIVLNPTERDLVLSEMRGLLSSVQGIVEGINQKDINRIVQSSRSAGMGAAGDVNPLLLAKLPMEFKKLAFSMHSDMDEIGKAAESGKPAPELLKMTTDNLAKCIACHASWQIRTSS